MTKIVLRIFLGIHSLQLIASLPLKMDHWKMFLASFWGVFNGPFSGGDLAVSFRESLASCFTNQLDQFIKTMQGGPQKTDRYKNGMK